MFIGQRFAFEHNEEETATRHHGERLPNCSERMNWSHGSESPRAVTMITTFIASSLLPNNDGKNSNQLTMRSSHSTWIGEPGAQFTIEASLMWLTRRAPLRHTRGAIAQLGLGLDLGAQFIMKLGMSEVVNAESTAKAHVIKDLTCTRMDARDEEGKMRIKLEELTHTALALTQQWDSGHPVMRKAR